MRSDAARPLVAEFIGTAMLLAAVVGSGLMAERLAGGNVALALLGNTLATGAMLVVLILMFGPVSGAHLNPAVTLAFRLRAELGSGAALGYVAAQVGGSLAGVWLAHLMFGETLFQLATRAREGPAQWLSECVATFGLVFAILAARRWGTVTVAAAVGLYISAAYWFTASTSFANPAVTLARALTDSFSGIAAGGVPAFVVAQCAGAALAVGLAAWLRVEPASLDYS